MAYRRSSWSYNGPVKVSFHWSNLVGCYALKFESIGNHWDSVKGVIDWLKLTVPSGEREYDDVDKTWFVHEKFFKVIKEVIEANPDFICTILEKPENIPAVTFVPVENYIAKFKELTGEDITSLEYEKALKLYRRNSLRLHPDRNGGDGSKMSELNQAWDIIKERHYKVAKVAMEQIQ